MHLGLAVLAPLLLAGATRSALASETLLAATTQNDAILVIDPETGLTNMLFPYTGFDALTAIAFDANGTLWGIDANGGSPFFVRVHPLSGNALPVGPTGIAAPAHLSGLDQDPTSGLLYAIERTTGDVYSIDTGLGTATWVGAAGGGDDRWEGLTFDSTGRPFTIRVPQAAPPEIAELNPATWVASTGCALPAVDPFVMEHLEARAGTVLNGVAKSPPLFGDDRNWLASISSESCVLDPIGSTGIVDGLFDAGLTHPPTCGIPPQSQRYGMGTAGSFGVPFIATNVPPNVPSVQPLEVRITSAKPDTPIVVLFAFLPLLPGQVQIFGGDLLVDPSTVVVQLTAVSDSQGSLVIPMGMVPPTLVLCGFSFYVQGFVLEGPTAQGGVAMTAGLELVFGS